MYSKIEIDAQSVTWTILPADKDFADIDSKFKFQRTCESLLKRSRQRFVNKYVVIEFKFRNTKGFFAALEKVLKQVLKRPDELWVERGPGWSVVSRINPVSIAAVDLTNPTDESHSHFQNLENESNTEPVLAQEVVARAHELDREIEARLRAITAELETWLASLKGLRFKPSEAHALECIRHTIQRAGCDLFYENSKVSMTWRQISQSLYLTIRLRTLESKPQQFLWSKVEFPLLQLKSKSMPSVDSGH